MFGGSASCMKDGFIPTSSLPLGEIWSFSETFGKKKITGWKPVPRSHLNHLEGRALVQLFPVAQASSRWLLSLWER